MTLDQVIALLWRRCHDAGSQAAWAKEHAISPAYVNDVLHGRREPGDTILAALGMSKIVTYRRRE